MFLIGYFKLLPFCIVTLLLLSKHNWLSCYLWFTAFCIRSVHQRVLLSTVRTLFGLAPANLSNFVIWPANGQTHWFACVPILLTSDYMIFITIFENWDLQTWPYDHRLMEGTNIEWMIMIRCTFVVNFSVALDKFGTAHWFFIYTELTCRPIPCLFLCMCILPMYMPSCMLYVYCCRRVLDLANAWFWQLIRQLQNAATTG